MKKFYIYKVLEKGTPGMLAFVQDVDAFAKSAYDPDKMSFTGVLIEALSQKEAFEVYYKPTSKAGKIYSVAEPLQTLMIQEQDKMQNPEELAIEIAEQVNFINEQMITLAKLVYDTVQPTNGETAEGYYEIIKDKYIEHLKKCQFGGQ